MVDLDRSEFVGEKVEKKYELSFIFDFVDDREGKLEDIGDLLPVSEFGLEDGF